MRSRVGMHRSSAVLVIALILVACSGSDVSDTSTTSTISATTELTSSSLSMEGATTSSLVTTTASPMPGIREFGEGWVLVGDQLQPRPHPHNVTETAFGLVAVGWACPEEGDCPAASWASVDGLTWIGSVDGEDGLGQVSLFEAVGFGSSVFASGGSCTQSFDHPDDCGGAIFASDDGLRWTRADDGVFGDCTDSVVFDCAMFARGLATDGNALVALVDEPVDEGTIQRPWSSTDGFEWNKAITTGESPLNIHTVIPSGIGFIGVGTTWNTDGENWWERFAVWSSTDGHTWSEVALPDAPFEEDHFLSAATGWGGGIAAFGEVCDLEWESCSKVMWTSGDGTKWTTTALGPEFDDVLVHRAFGVGDALVLSASIDAPLLAVTTNATDWEMYTLDPSVFDSMVPLEGLIEYDGLFIGVGGHTGIVVTGPDST